MSRPRDYEWNGEDFVAVKHIIDPDVLGGSRKLHGVSDTIEVTELGGDPRFYKLLTELSDLHSRKNTDYSKGGSQGPLGNFQRVSQIKRLYQGLDWSSPLGTALDYLLKQLDAALILYTSGLESLTGEPVPSRLKDVAVYALLGMLLYEDEQVAPITVRDCHFYTSEAEPTPDR